MFTESERQRLDALINGAFAADERGNVAITVRDLRWLVCLVDSLIWEIATIEKQRQPVAQSVAPPAAETVIDLEDCEDSE